MELKLEECLENINKNREKVEAPFVFCLWKDPDLFDDYKKVNAEGDETIKTDDGQFYFALGRALYDAGYRTFDNLTINTFLEDKPTLKKEFQELGGYHEVNELKQLVDVNNVDAYYDKIAKLNILNDLCRMNFKMFSNIKQFNNMSSQNIYDLFEYQLNNVSLAVEQDVKIEDLELDDAFIEECNKGETLGLDYSENCPKLCSKTMGLPIGDIYLLGGYSGAGKSSFIFNNMVLPLAKSGTKTVIISNEMKINAYKSLLLVHILSHDMNYWDLTRKKIKSGNFSKEELEKIYEAKEIQKEKYKDIKFVKLFDSDINKVIKIGKKLSKLGYKCLIYDTMKASDDSTSDGAMWQQILLDSRRLFQLASKEELAVVMSYQLAIHTENIRFTSSSCLSNAKQVKEVISEGVFIRKIWDDELDENSKYYCHPYKLRKTESGKYIKTDILLNKDKKYLIAFLDKTRNDEDGIQFIYEWNARYNKWIEIGYCTIVNTHGI